MLVITPNAIAHVENFEKKMRKIDRVLPSRKGIDWTDEFPTSAYAKFEDDPACILEAITYGNSEESDGLIDTFLVSTTKRLLGLAEEYDSYDTIKFAVADFKGFVNGNVSFETLEASFNRVNHALLCIDPNDHYKLPHWRDSKIGSIEVELLRFVYVTLYYVLGRHRNSNRYMGAHWDRWDILGIARYLDRVARTTFSPAQEKDTQLETIRALLGCDKS